MTIRKKLILLLVFPLLVIISFAGTAVYNLYNSQQEASQISELVQLSAISGQLIHEMQKERGMSVGFLGSKGASFNEELKGQRKLVDEKVGLFRETVAAVPKQFFSASLQEDLGSVYSELDKIPEFRKQVNELGMPAGAAAAFYTGINKKLIKGVVGYSFLTKDNEITGLITGYALFLSGKDYAGIERAMLSAAFGADKFTSVVFDKYVNAKASQAEDFNNFTLYASEQSVTMFSEFREGEAYANVEKLRAIADEKITTGGFGVKPTDWFAAKTVKINQLKEIEDAQVEEILAIAGAQMSQTKTMIMIWAVGLVCVFVVVTFIGRNMFVSIISPMENLLEAAASIAIGHVEMDPIEEVTDELGGVSFMFHSMMENITESMEKMEKEKALANQAVQKAKALQEDTTRSEKELKSSVHVMLTALESFADGDLSMELPAHPNAEINRLYEGYNTALAKVRSLILQLKQVTEQSYLLTAKTNQIGSKIAKDAHALSDKSSDVAHTTGSMAESMTDNAKLATSTSEMSIESGQAAEKGIRIVEETVHRIQSIADTVNRCVVVIDKLGKSSQEITGIVSVIEDIAEQTNLLALNAAIEAARAGESGRGFAVVAEEVRNLSERTKDSTRQIETVIKALKIDTGNAVEVMQEGQQLVNEGLELADNAHQALQGIGENVQTMVQVVTRIAASIEVEATRSNQAAGLMKEINGEAQQTSESVRQIVDALQKLDVFSGEVTNLVEIFNVGSGAQVDTPTKELVA